MQRGALLCAPSEYVRKKEAGALSDAHTTVEPDTSSFVTLCLSVERPGKNNAGALSDAHTMLAPCHN